MKRPHDNCYWVQAGRLLAGEYPRDLDTASSAAKLRSYLDAGVDYFIDLTEEGELQPYDALLHDLAGANVVHKRFAIPDKSVPASAALMRAILADIAQALAAGRVVYVHCWGGVGRTGTVVACHLIEQGMSAEVALAQLAAWWQTVAKSNRLPVSPETPAQRDWVLAWPQQ
ncbi:Dual specificity phosphatase, catalytic domain [Andreprevotia lacus DSM 23236]|jgi:hypothetical protein|uniref:Dual specificity phosphatase, catalytic domain n=1 Tax=Andreprevotia lacus DSM 23236 TaxID=1121001 RepID=A0A1W1X6M2_9NEIS|nr:dual specificity protein phosphatase family protein [Andreprevotia lacus]SMC19586.1 Dual specificity phosphatase, catalytic domain [Andreprevotia lacus DSM 23236]